MKASEADILVIPGLDADDADHWYSRWESRLSTARRIPPPSGGRLDAKTWTEAITDAVNGTPRPVVLVAHAAGVAAAVHAAPAFIPQRVRGGFFVAPPDLDSRKLKPAGLRALGPYSRDPLPFPSMVVASRSDPHCDYAVAEDLAAAWGSDFADAGDAGRIDAASGFGPWPEGSLTFAKFLARL